MKSSSIHVKLPAQPAAVERGFLNLGLFPCVGRSLTVNSRYLELNGKPWLPVMGEFHYSRYPEAEWEAELRKMRAGGVSIVASYVFWNHHEELEGRYDWSARRDLRRFVMLAAKAGLYFYLRPGPWVHAEARNGGFPDWLLGKGELRCNAPEYLAQVAKFYGEIGAQLKGLMWSDGGPVIGVQLENEYDRIGPGCGAEHIGELKRIAIAAGLKVPLYTVTGWPTLDIPPREVVPVSGAYPDGFWQGSAEALPASGVFVFDTERTIGEMGNVGGTAADGCIDKTHYPFFLAEAGGGMHTSYHRRVVVTEDDVAATALVQVGSGATLYGYYMYHGGINPQSSQGRLNETQDTGYPNDVAVFGYDFHAPLGQYGQVRASYGRLRTLHLFLDAFGDELAPMEAVLPEGATADAADRSRLRLAVRGAADAGFVFINNHVRHHPLPDFKDVRISIETRSRTLSLPRLDLPSGSYLIWPFGQRLGSALMHHATVQPLSRWNEGQSTTWVGFQHPACAARLCFDPRSVRILDAANGQIEVESEGLVLVLPDEAIQVIRIEDADGIEHRIVILARELADQAARMRLSGRERLVLCRHALYRDEQGIVVAAPDGGDALFHVFPGEDLAAACDDHGFARFDARAGAPAGVAPAAPRVELLHDQPLPPAVRLGPHIPWRSGPVPLAPDDAEFEQASRIRLVPGIAVPAGAERMLLAIDYVGEAARLYADGVLVDDNFHDGEPWFVGIDRYARDGSWPDFELRIVAARPELPVFREAAAHHSLAKAAHPASVRNVTASVWRQYRLAFGE